MNYKCVHTSYRISNMWPQKGHDTQVENHWSRQWKDLTSFNSDHNSQTYTSVMSMEASLLWHASDVAVADCSRMHPCPLLTEIIRLCSGERCAGQSSFHKRSGVHSFTALWLRREQLSILSTDNHWTSDYQYWSILTCSQLYKYLLRYSFFSILWLPTSKPHIKCWAFLLYALNPYFILLHPLFFPALLHICCKHMT